MTKSKAVRRYIRVVSRNLTCYKLTRFKLLSGLTQELSEYAALTYEELCEKVGSPMQTAVQLMENVDELEISNVMKNRRLAIGLSGGLLIAAVLVLGIYSLQVQHILRGDFYVKEHFVEKNTISDKSYEEFTEEMERQELGQSESKIDVVQGE